MTSTDLTLALTARERLRLALDAWPDDADTHHAFTLTLAAYDELGAQLKLHGAISTPLPSPVTEAPLEHRHD